jgi:hypothetical protein
MPRRVSKKGISKKVDISQSPLAREFPLLKGSSAGCEKVWTGTIARLRIYDQPGSTGNKVFVYLAPGANSNYVGYSADANMIHALFLARDNGNTVTGYTNNQCRIEWLDY